MLFAATLLWLLFFRPATSGGGISQPPPSRPSLGKVVTYEVYKSAVEDALLDARRAREASGSEREKALEDAIAALESVEGAQVSIPATQSSPAEVDNTLTLQALRANSSDLEDIDSSLVAIIEALESTQNRGVIEGTLAGEQANAELRNVLGAAEFDYESRLSPLQRLIRWLAGATGQADPGGSLWRVFTALIAAIAAGTVTYLASDRLGNRWARLGLAIVVGAIAGALFFIGVEALDETLQVLGAVGIVVAAVAVILIFSGLSRGSSSSTRPRAISELAEALGMASPEARKRAEEAAGAGDYRSAIRYRCLSVLLTLDEEGKLQFDRAATDREYLFRAPGGLQEELQPLLERFEAVWYGGEEAGAEDWQVYTARAAAIEARVTAQERRAA